MAVLVEQLRDDQPPSRISAAQRLALYRDPAAAPALAERLADSARELRVAAALALAACGTRESVPPLLEALSDRDPLVAQAAAVALENLTGHTEDFNAFTPEDAGPPGTALAAVDCRSPLGDDRAGTRRAAGKPRPRRRPPGGGRVGTHRQQVGLHLAARLRADASRRQSASGMEEDPQGRRHPVQLAGRGESPDDPGRDASLGYLRDADAVPLLAETLAQHDHPDTGNLFLAEAAVEALGRIGTPEAEAVLVEAFAALDDYPKYTLWYGDHPALMACHASPVHYFIAEALDRLGSTRAERILPQPDPLLAGGPGPGVAPGQRRLRGAHRPRDSPPRGRSGRGRDVPGDPG